MIRIRTAREEDIGHILSMARQVSDMTLKHRSGFFGETREFRTDPHVYAQALRAEDSMIFVAEDDGRDAVGYVYATVQREPDDLIAIPYVSVGEIAVKTTHQGLGIGKSLLEQIHEWARGNGIRVVQLAVWEFNAGARKLYEGAGYKTIMRKMEKVLE